MSSENSPSKRALTVSENVAARKIYNTSASAFSADNDSLINDIYTAYTKPSYNTDYDALNRRIQKMQVAARGLREYYTLNKDAHSQEDSDSVISSLDNLNNSYEKYRSELAKQRDEIHKYKTENEWNEAYRNSTAQAAYENLTYAEKLEQADKLDAEKASPAGNISYKASLGTNGLRSVSPLESDTIYGYDSAAQQAIYLRNYAYQSGTTSELKGTIDAIDNLGAETREKRKKYGTTYSDKAWRQEMGVD